MNVQLYQGDCLEILKTLPDGCVDAVITSPPYFNARDYSHFATYDDYLTFLREFVIMARRLLKPDRLLVVNLSCVIEPRLSRAHESRRLPIPFDFVGIATRGGFKFLDEIIWQKPDGASNRARTFDQHRHPVAYKPYQVTEYALIFKNGEGLLDYVIRAHDAESIKSSRIKDGYERTNVWRISPERVEGHPAPFPIALANKLVTYYSFVGDTILDPFMGSGTTGVACVQTGRNFIGIELDPGYFSIAEKRIAEAQMQLPLLEAAG